MKKSQKAFAIETQRLIIRPYTLKDTDAAWHVLSHPLIYPTTYAIPKNYPRERVIWWIQYVDANIKNGSSYEFGIFDKQTGEYIGNCGIINILAPHKSGMITYFIDPEKWRNGYATESSFAMLSFAFDILQLNRVGGSCMAINPASAAVMRKIGMIYEGNARQELCKDGVYLDIYHFSILKSEYMQKRAAQG